MFRDVLRQYLAAEDLPGDESGAAIETLAVAEGRAAKKAEVVPNLQLEKMPLVILVSPLPLRPSLAWHGVLLSRGLGFADRLHPNP